MHMYVRYTSYTINLTHTHTHTTHYTGFDEVRSSAATHRIPNPAIPFLPGAICSSSSLFCSLFSSFLSLPLSSSLTSSLFYSLFSIFPSHFFLFFFFHFYLLLTFSFPIHHLSTQTHSLSFSLSSSSFYHPYFLPSPPFPLSLLTFTFTLTLFSPLTLTSHHILSSPLLTIPSDQRNPPNRSFKFLLHFIHKASRYISRHGNMKSKYSYCCCSTFQIHTINFLISIFIMFLAL